MGEAPEGTPLDYTRAPMRLVVALLVLRLEAPPDLVPAEARRAAALQLHEERRYAAAAALLEELAEQTGRGDDLFNAGQSRFAAGHRAHALRLWEAYAADRSRRPEDLAAAEERIAAARALTSRVELVVRDPTGGSVVTIRRRYDPPDQERPAIVLPPLEGQGGGVSVLRLALDPGVWEIEVRAGGVAWTHHELHLDRSDVRVELAPPAPPADTGVPGPGHLRVALSASSAAVTLVGTALAAVGGMRTAAQLDVCASRPVDPACSEARLLDAVRLTDFGAGIIGAGVGGLAGGLASGARGRGALLGQFLVGGLSVVAGAAWVIAENLAYPATEVQATYLAEMRGWHVRRAAASALLGAGAGLGVGASVGALVRGRRAALRVSLDPARAGLRAVLDF